MVMLRQVSPAASIFFYKFSSNVFINLSSNAWADSRDQSLH